MIHRFDITAQNAGERLDVFLTTEFPEMTRSLIAKLLRNGAGKVNGTKASVHRFLKEGEVVEFDDAVSKNKNQPEKKPVVQKPLPKLKIIRETADWLVINKPSGLMVHPDANVEIGTLVDLLVAHDPAIAKIGEDPSRPGIMHRLDKDVSGLMVIAKTQDAYDHLKKQFAEHSVEKHYLALVHGEVSHDEGDITFRIGRSSRGGRMAAIPTGSKEGKAARTHYKVIKRFRGAGLVELEIFSGRTHQIRAHMHGLGHPVMGDSLYILRQTDRNVTVPRLLLQSIVLGFTDPATGTRERFTLPPDPAFDAVMKTFKPHEPKEQKSDA
ncbi:MAG: RluA family pseudouridine synthase [Patescibacteria group bacterium]|jgi:23S rRNA pseudouridine1911/1915/1917 synthase